MPYGWWPSPIGAEVVAARSRSYDAVHTTADTVAWLETRPAEGRTVVATWTPGRGTRIATPDGFDVGTGIHAYGGGAFTLTPAGLVVANAQDQRLYLIDPDGAARPITPPGEDRYGDLRALDTTTLVGVRERPGGADDLVVLSLDGSAPPRTIQAGHDFYAFPRPNRLNRETRQLAWVSWDDPNLPWNGSDLWVADLFGSGPDICLGPARHVAGGPTESVVQPEWGPDTALYFISDRYGWWNLCRARDYQVQPLLPREAEFTDAPWELDYSTYVFLPDGRIACRYRRQGADHLGIVEPAAGRLQPLPVPFTSIKPYLRATRDRLAFIAAAPTTTPAVVTLGLSDHRLGIVASDDPVLPAADVSLPELLRVPAADGDTVHAAYYPPTRHASTGPSGQRPPLIVQPHPGPTSHTPLRLELRTQFFTSRGFAVATVDYRGSTGYGRAYRTRLDGQWGVLDVQDCVAVADFLAARGSVDIHRCMISGASAGGFTALQALATTGRFAGGASWFGITDLAVFRAHVPRFQRHHTDHLVGPWPDAAARYRARSPVHNADRITRPVLIIHGLDDDIVIPEHAELIVAALGRHHVPVTQLAFPGEGHGLRHPGNIHRAIEAELTFYRMLLTNSQC